MDEIEYLAAQEGIVGLYNYEREQKRIGATLKAQGYEEGKAEGLEEGLKKGASLGISTSMDIIKFIKEGLKDEEISMLTNTSIEVVKEIRSNI